MNGVAVEPLAACERVDGDQQRIHAVLLDEVGDPQIHAAEVLGLALVAEHVEGEHAGEGHEDAHGDAEAQVAPRAAPAGIPPHGLDERVVAQLVVGGPCLRARFGVEQARVHQTPEHGLVDAEARLDVAALQQQPASLRRDEATLEEALHAGSDRARHPGDLVRVEVRDDPAETLFAAHLLHARHSRFAAPDTRDHRALDVLADELELEGFDEAVTQRRRAGLRQEAQQRIPRLRLEGEGRRVEILRLEGRGPLDGGLRLVHRERFDLDHDAENVRQARRQLVELPEEVLPERHDHPQLGRVRSVAGLVGLGIEVVASRHAAADEIGELRDERLASVRRLQREQLLELIEHQHRRDRRGSVPDLQGLEEVPQRAAVEGAAVELVAPLGDDALRGLEDRVREASLHAVHARDDGQVGAFAQGREESAVQQRGLAGTGLSVYDH